MNEYKSSHYYEYDWDHTLIVIALHTSIYISRTLNSGDASGSSTEDLDDIWDNVLRRLWMEFPLSNFGFSLGSYIVVVLITKNTQISCSFDFGHYPYNVLFLCHLQSSII